RSPGEGKHAMTLAIRTGALTKSYGSHTALRNLDLRVEAGSIFGLIGPNGAGKKTTLRLLLDIIRPTSGDVIVLGEHPRFDGAGLRRRILYVPGELSRESRVTVRSLLNHLAQLSGPVALGTINELAERPGLDLARPVRSLSKG